MLVPVSYGVSSSWLCTTMSICALPEEILSKILALVLLIPRNIFYGLQCGTKSKDRQRHPCLLLVSKYWLRIGTPLLYESVVLTRTSDTQTVAKLVRSHPSVGKAIRRIKLQPSDGGLEDELYDIVRMAPNIDNLYFDGLQLQPRHSLSGLQSSIPALDVKRLHICHINIIHLKAVANKANQLILEGMKDHWPSLVRLSPVSAGFYWIYA